MCGDSVTLSPLFSKRAKTHIMKKTLLFTILAAVTSLRMASAGDITGTVTLKGTPPKEVEIAPLKNDPNCGQFHPSMPTTHFYKVGDKGELADVVVSVQGINAKSTGASAAPVVLNQKGCEYTPSLFALQTGQRIAVKNSDPVLHNVHTHPTETSGNKEANLPQTAGAPDLVFSFDHPEPFLKFSCEVHPWMFAWGSVFDHPFFAVSGKDGSFTIANVPAGKYKIQAAHRKLGSMTQEVEVKDGQPAKVDFTLEVK
jgi:plastocyanin